MTEAHRDYETVRTVLEHITENWRDQPELEDLARLTGHEATSLQKTFTRWAGLSPKAFLQAITLDHAKRMLGDGLRFWTPRWSLVCPVPADCTICL